MAARFRHRPEILRFIEFMDVGSSNGWRAEQVVTASEIVDVIQARWPLEPLAPERAGEVATRAPKTIAADDLAAKALEVMEAWAITSLVAVNAGGRPTGVIHMHDILRAKIV